MDCNLVEGGGLDSWNIEHPSTLQSSLENSFSLQGLAFRVLFITLKAKLETLNFFIVVVVPLGLSDSSCSGLAEADEAASSAATVLKPTENGTRDTYNGRCV